MRLRAEGLLQPQSNITSSFIDQCSDGTVTWGKSFPPATAQLSNQRVFGRTLNRVRLKKFPLQRFYPSEQGVGLWPATIANESNYPRTNPAQVEKTCKRRNMQQRIVSSCLANNVSQLRRKAVACSELAVANGPCKDEQNRLWQISGWINVND